MDSKAIPSFARPVREEEKRAEKDGRRLHHLERDPAKLESFVLWRINESLDDVDATDVQRRAILSRARLVIRDAVALHEEHEADHDEIMAELESGRPDADWLHEMLDRRFEEVRAFAHRSLDRTLEAYGLLDETQRSILLEDFEDHFDRNHGR
ncbi:MAG: hypothetical protein R6V85_02825 [Polyangia bacterium]